MDSTGIGMQPKYNSSPYFAIYFMAFMIVGALFVMNMFVAVVIENFNKNKERGELGPSFITESQKQWI
jgi:hypothetical protein